MAKSILTFCSRRTRRSRRRIRRIPKGRIHVQAGFDNIIVTVTDLHGRVLSSSSAGNCGLRGKRKGTPFDGEAVAGNALSSVVMKRAEVMIKGPGLGRVTALRAIQSSPERTAGKRICKNYVQRGLGLASHDINDSSHVTDRVPLVVCITRLVAQKGLHLITHAIKRVEELANDCARKSSGLVLKENLKILRVCEELSHMLYAAADFMSVPSIYEPCGLSQLIGMRYGAVPILRKTGGLADTVFDVDDQSQPELANGFVSEGIDEGSFNSALERAFSFYHKQNEWEKIVKKVVKIDYSWNNKAGKYIDLYNSMRVR